MLTISAAGFVIFCAMLIVALYVLRLIAQRTADHPFGQGLAALVH
jgi:hypothetical protein